MIDIQVKGVKDALLKLPDTRKVRQAAMTSLNRIGRGVLTEADRGIREDYTIKRGDIRSNISVSKATPSRLAVSLSGKTKKLSLKKFQIRVSSARPKPGVPSVRVRVKKAGSLKPIRTAFQARMRSGHVGIFRRRTRQRLPIRELTGPSVYSMASSGKVISRIRRRAEREFEPEFKRNLERTQGRKR